MALKTINDFPAVTSLDTDDYFLAWRGTQADTVKILRGDAIGAALSGGFALAVGGNSSINGELSGGGSLDTGGFALTLGGNSVLNGELLGGFAGTLPADGTIALRDVAGTFSALQTFSAGIKFANQTLNYYNFSTWTPVVADATTGGNVASGTFNGTWLRIGNFVHVGIRLSNINTAGMTAGNVLVVRGFPFTSLNNANYRISGVPVMSNVAFTGSLSVGMGPNVTFANFAKTTTGAAVANLIVSDFTSGTALAQFSLNYQCEP